MSFFVLLSGGETSSKAEQAGLPAQDWMKTIILPVFHLERRREKELFSGL